MRRKLFVNQKSAKLKTLFSSVQRSFEKARTAVEKQEKDMVEKIKLAQKKLDKAVKKGVLKQGVRSRYLSRMTTKANKLVKKA